MDDSNFINGLNKKDEKAWSQLYDYYYASLCNYASRIINDDHFATDIVQELFIKIWKQDNKFLNIKALTTYLYRSSRNSAINYLKSKKVKEKRMAEYTSSKIPDDDVLDDSMIAMVEEEMIREMNYFIAKLPEDRKKIINLCRKGLTVKEIADELKISVNTVKTQKKRAYAYLKERLKDSIFVLILFS